MNNLSSASRNNGKKRRKNRTLFGKIKMTCCPFVTFHT